MKGEKSTVLGIEKLCGSDFKAIKGARVGLVCNQASVDRNLQHSADLLAALEGIELKALFGPQHGIRGDVQDNMVETPHDFDAETGVPVYSLYLSEDRAPTPEMLKDVDVLVYDLQEVGGRTWTYVSTMALAMQAAKAKGIPFVVLDRPNPIGGEIVEGALLDPGSRRSWGCTPSRHATG